VDTSRRRVDVQGERIDGALSTVLIRYVGA
jgi:hypothetical protein